jgi:hypothetical protein
LGSDLNTARAAAHPSNLYASLVPIAEVLALILNGNKVREAEVTDKKRENLNKHFIQWQQSVMINKGSLVTDWKYD